MRLALNSHHSERADHKERRTLRVVGAPRSVWVCSSKGVWPRGPKSKKEILRRSVNCRGTILSGAEKAWKNDSRANNSLPVDARESCGAVGIQKRFSQNTGVSPPPRPPGLRSRQQKIGRCDA